MKNLMNLKGAKALNKKEQKQIIGGQSQPQGGHGPCGPLGGTILFGKSEAACRLSGGIWQGGKCWVCFQ